MGKHPDLSRTAAALDAYDADPTEENAPPWFALGPGIRLAGMRDLPFVRRMVRRWTKAQGSSKKNLDQRVLRR